MGTSLSPNPANYVPGTTDSTVVKRDIPYGDEMVQQLNYYQNATRVTGGNPVAMFFTGGGFGSKDKTSALEGSYFQKIQFAMMMNNSYGYTSPAWDVVSVQCREHAIDPSSQSASSLVYSPTYSGAVNGPGFTQYPGYGLTWVDDAQRAVQFIKDNTARFGCNAAKVVVWGDSAGGTIALDAAFSPSRHFTIPTKARSKWDAFSNSNVVGVLNFFGVIDLSPWFTDFTLVGGDFGFENTDLTKMRADMEKLLLVPDSSGLYPSTVAKSPICKSVSPMDVIAASFEDQRAAKVYSLYRDFETTTVPVTTYSTIPPYTAHDVIQMGLLAARCASVGIDHTSYLYSLSQGGGDTQIATEVSVPPIMAWLNSLVDF